MSYLIITVCAGVLGLIESLSDDQGALLEYLCYLQGLLGNTRLKSKSEHPTVLFRQLN